MTTTERTRLRLTGAAAKLEAALADMRHRRARSLDPSPVSEVLTTLRQTVATLDEPLPTAPRETPALLKSPDLDAMIEIEKQEHAARQLARLRGESP